MELKLDLKLEPRTVHRPEELVARATFTNVGPNVLHLNALAMSSPSLALRLRRAGGEDVPLGPPPVPFPDDDVRTRLSLATGQSRSFIYENFLPQPLPPGDYEICLRYRGVETASYSSWVSFMKV